MRENRLRMKLASAVIVALLLSSMFLTITLVKTNLTPSIPNPNTLVYTTSGDYISTFDPAGVDDPISMMVVSNCYDTLVVYDRERMDRFRPLLVTEVPSLENGRISADGLTYRFTIRNDSTLTPEDVEYSFERVMVYGGFSENPTWMFQEALLGVWPTWDENDTLLVSFEDIDNAVEVEGNDVVFHLAMIYPPFMHILASSCSSIVSRAWCVEHGDWPGTEATWELSYDSPLVGETQGFGPFKLESLTYESWGYSKEIVLVRNEGYWREPASLEKIVIQSLNRWEGSINQAFEIETRKHMFLKGSADICSVPEENYADLEEVEGIRVYSELPTLQYSALNFNFAIAKNSPFIESGELDGNGIPPDFFSDIDIRKAFAYALDYDAIINESYAGEALRPASPILEGVPFHNPDQEGYIYDLGMAQQHFQQAWDGEVWDKGFNLTLVYSEEPMGYRWEPYPLWPMAAEILKDSIEAINTKFHVTLQNAEISGWFETTRNLTAFICPWTGNFPDPHNFVVPFMASTGDFGYGNFRSWATPGYNDSTVDSLIDAGMNTVDPAERQAIYYELQRIYHEDVPGIPLVQPLARHYQRDWVWGWYHNPAAAGMDFYEILKGTYQDATRNIVTHIDDLVDSGVLRVNAGNSLTDKLGSAIYLMDMGDLLGGSLQLNDFIEQVNSLESLVENEEELIALAQEIIEVLPKTPLSILITRAFSLSVLVLAGGLFIATIALLLDRKKERIVQVEVIRVSIAYTLLSRLRESRWNIFRRKKESE